MTETPTNLEVALRLLVASEHRIAVQAALLGAVVLNRQD